MNNGNSKIPEKFGGRQIRTTRYPKHVGWAGIIVVTVYFIRGTVLPLFAHIPESILIGLTLIALMSCLGVVVMAGGKWRWWWLFVVCVFGFGCLGAEHPVDSILHWFGIIGMIFAVGPLISNPVGYQLRMKAWKFTTDGIVILSIIFLIWYLLHLPSYGGSLYFSSFMNQSMLLGPIVGIGISIALIRAIHMKSWLWGGGAILGVLPLFASGSRLATLSTGVAICFLFLRRKPILGLIFSVVISVAITLFFTHGGELKSEDSAVGMLAKKGTKNSRTDLWQSRIDEFKSSPIIGIGISMGSGSGVSKSETGIRVEPGSSYLAIFSMTGILGAFAFFSGILYVICRYAFNKNGSPLQNDVLSVTGIYLGVHGIAEGWVLGFGSPLCLLFWLWLGRLADASETQGNIAKTSRMRMRFNAVRMGRAKMVGPSPKNIETCACTSTQGL